MKKNSHKQTLSESLIIEKYLKKLNFKKKESFNFENDGAYLNVAKDEKIIVSNDAIVEGVDFFTNDSADSIAHKIIALFFFLSLQTEILQKLVCIISPVPIGALNLANLIKCLFL